MEKTAVMHWTAGQSQDSSSWVLNWNWQISLVEEDGRLVKEVTCPDLDLLT